MKKREIINVEELSKKNQEVMTEFVSKAKKGSLILAGNKTVMVYKGFTEKRRVWTFK